MGRTELGILESMATRCRLAYVSDLRLFLSERIEIDAIVRVVTHMPAHNWPAEEWCSAVHYLTHEQCNCSDAEEAKAFLLKRIKE